MLKVLIVIDLVFFLSGFPQREYQMEYELINQVLESKSIQLLDEEFYFSEKGKFETYGEFSLAFSQDLLNPAKSFDLDSLYTPSQILEFEKKLKIQKPEQVDWNRIKHKAKISKPKDELSFGVQLSFPIIQKGKSDELYGFIFYNRTHLESGEKSIELYRLDGEKWILISSTVVAIS